MACITVGPRSVQKLEFPCIAGVKLLYSFRVQDRKVELSGDYHDGNCNNNNGSVSSSSVVILDKRWLNQEDGIVSGEWVNNTATTTTTTTIVFSLDNTHSLMRSKRVFYKIQFES